MPTAFSEREREQINEELVEQGRRMVARRGLRDTTVAHLADAAGIAKGSFYAFFESKEHLVLEILEQEARAIRERLLEELDPDAEPAVRTATLMRRSFEMVDASPFLRRLLLAEDIPPSTERLLLERGGRHITSVSGVLSETLPGWDEIGTCTIASQEVTAGLLRALLLVRAGRRFVGEDIHDDVFGLLIDLLAGELVRRTTES